MKHPPVSFIYTSHDPNFQLFPSKFTEVNLLYCFEVVKDSPCHKVRIFNASLCKKEVRVDRAYLPTVNRRVLPSNCLPILIYLYGRFNYYGT